MKPETEWTPRQREIINAIREHGSQRKAAKVLGISPGTISGCLDRLKISTTDIFGTPSVPVPDPIPEPDLPIEELLDYRRRSFEQMAAHKEAKRWRPYRVPTDGPYGLMFFGDPHIDDDGCHLPLLEATCELAATTPAVYAVNIGDTTNNWSGRLMRLWADQGTSAKQARQLFKWLLTGSGVPWFLWLHGNHDLWDGPVSSIWAEAVKPNFVTMEDWEAKVTLVSPNGQTVRLWAAHNFKGHSQWNPLHGPLKAAQMGDWAHIYVAGHHHNWGIMQGEHDHRGFVYNILRARGFKYIDSYAEQHGFGCHRYGAAPMVVVDPSADKPNMVTPFNDPFEGAEFLTWKRQRAGLA